MKPSSIATSLLIHTFFAALAFKYIPQEKKEFVPIDLSYHASAPLTLKPRIVLAGRSQKNSVPKTIAFETAIGRTPASISVRAQPNYPARAKTLGQQGLVELLVEVDRKGLVKELALKKSSGYSMLDEAALTAVKSWEFIPASDGGHAVNSKVVVPVRFEITR